MRLCVVIPTYNHGSPLRQTLDALSTYRLPSFVVDDGSDDSDKHLIRAATRRYGAELITLPHNLGKGGATIEGLRRARDAGFTHALQIDADGQHDAGDVAKFVSAANNAPGAMIAGDPVFDESAPSSRLRGRRLNNFWVAVETWSMKIPDAMCGFRVYPLTECLDLIASVRMTTRMDFDIEIMVRLAWKGVPIVPIPTRVRYFDDAVSNFRLWHDNLLITKLHTRLFFGMLARLPTLVVRRVGARGRHWSRIAERGGAAGMRILFAVYRTLGRRAFKLLLVPVVTYFFLTATGARGVSNQYLARVRARLADRQLPPDNQLGSFRHFLAFGDAVLDKVAMWASAFDGRAIEFDDPETYKRFRRENRGSCFIGSHLGNLEVLRAFGETVQKMTVNALVYTRHSPKFLRVLTEVNPLVTEHMIEVDSLGPDAILKLRERIAAGEHVAIVGDRTSINHEERSVAASFLGDDALFPEGPFVIAHLLACPVYLIFCLKQNGFYRIYLEKFADPLELPRQSREQALQEVVARYAQRLEHYCLKAPLQWFNFFDFWRFPAHGEDDKT